ncbi:uncharacterized protein LOC133825549 [Humulus lupulus]|uniref:uncharacterized protein LOC133825549 n=1 Tax=Humulus lupulus TaxID=3486 RepID=UPI002B401138|nr:uncharacterized protein LOC133825549 [Humulus lupulus]
MNALKKTRSRTTLANLTKRNNDSMKINWIEKGQPVGTNSAYYDLHEDWQKNMCFEMMANLWRSAKSRLVKDIIDAKTENERLALKPDCIKSDVEWRAFVKQKTSKEHMAIRAKFQERRKKSVPHTMSRRGYARTINDMTKQTEGGKEELAEIIREDPKSGTTNNTDEDALTKLFGNPKSGLLIGQGRGVTKSKLTVVNMCKDKMTLLEEEQLNMKIQIAEMLNLLKGHLGGRATTSEGQSHNIPQSNNIPSPKGHNFTEVRNTCYLLNWSDVIIVEGRWDSCDLDLEVHGIPLGPDFMHVWVDVAIVPSAYSFRPNYVMLTIREAVGSTVRWPTQKLTAGAMAGGSRIKKKRGRPKRGPSPSKVPRQTKSLVEILGVEPIQFSDDEELGEVAKVGEAGTEKRVEDVSLTELQQRSQIRVQFSHLMELKNSNQACTVTDSKLLEKMNTVYDRGIEKSQSEDFVKIDLEDIEEEVNYWNSSIVCYVLGANPPLPVMEGFCRRVWKNLGIDKVAGIGHGVFMVRFNTVEQRDNVLKNGIMFFDKKPLIMKPWTAHEDFRKEDIQRVPVWIQLANLELKYWGEKTLFKIVSQIGKPLKVDPITKQKEKLNFARVMIEVTISQSFPSVISFINEHNRQTDVIVNYEWKPTICSQCKGMGHETSMCEKKPATQVWLPKNSKKDNKSVGVDADGFSVVKAKGKRSFVNDGNKKSPIEEISNPFHVLGESEQWVVREDSGVDNTLGGGEPPLEIGLVGLLETKVKAKKLGALFLNMFSSWCFTSNNAWHKNGRILLAWNPNIFSVDIRFCSQQCIHCWVVPRNGVHPFFCTFVYAFNAEESRKVLWKQIRDIKVEDPWVLLGDFNATIYQDERIGDRVRSFCSSDFSDCLHDCGLVDLPYNGCFYTWSNKQEPPNRIVAKLDRVLGNKVWLDCFNNTAVYFMPEGLFDHSPAILSLSANINMGKKPFRYFKMWQRFDGYHNCVTAAWNQQINGSPMFRVVSKLKKVKENLKNLNQFIIGDIGAAFSQSERELLNIKKQSHLDPQNAQLIREEAEYRKTHERLHEAYSEFLRQKAKLIWLNLGDANTKVFHRSIRMRRLRNSVLAIRDGKGQWQDSQPEIQTAFLDYFQHLLGSEKLDRKSVKRCIIREGPVLTQESILFLKEPFRKQDIKEAVFDIPGDKAPGPDGFSSSFFQHHWDLIGEEVSDAILSFLETGKILKEINNTTITLVPKLRCPENVSNFRPISCCNVIYKVAAKLLCNRLRKVLPGVVAWNHGGFIKGRSITHNVMICQDLVRHYGRKGAKPNCLMKLDLRKAYDMLDWDFIEELLVALNFPAHFTQLIMVCVRTPKFSIMLNGSLHGFFNSKRGLRQGDPMSPLLFVLAMEYLSRILKKLARDKDFQFHERCENLQLNHLCFADDVVLFSHGDFKSVYKLLQGFELFSQSSGLTANYSKSELITSGIQEVEVQRILSMSKLQRGSLPFRYLGVPISAKHFSHSDCEGLISKMAHIVEFPRRVMGRINEICRNFLWKGVAEFGGPGYVAWENVCQSKFRGGLGIRNFSLWNSAALGKYVWDIAANKENLWVKWIHAVYIKRGFWWDYEAPLHASWYWKKIVAVKNRLKEIYSFEDFISRHYSIKDSYGCLVDNMMGSSVRENLAWTKYIWNAYLIPKHAFISWLAYLNKLKTKDRLLHFGIATDANCLIWGHDKEDGSHLFFSCCYSKRCLAEIKNWLGWTSKSENLQGLLRWLSRGHGISRFRRGIFAASIGASVYHIWRVRNLSFWEGKVLSTDCIVNCIKRDIKNRGQLLLKNRINMLDRNWFGDLIV